MTVLILGGGHGTQALDLIPDQKIFFGSWDDGGSSGFLRLLYPETLPFGDLRAVITAKLKSDNRIYLADLLNIRTANSNELLSQYLTLNTHLQNDELNGFQDFLEQYYEDKLRYLLKHLRTLVPEDNLGNVILCYLYRKNGIKAIRSWLSTVLNLKLDFDFIFSIPVHLYGYYYDPTSSRLKLLDSESVIDTWHYPIIKFNIKDANAEIPTVNSTLITNLQKAESLFLAPGSPENYLPAFTKELIQSVQKNNLKVILLAQLFITPKDQPLLEQINTLSNFTPNLEVWLPDKDSIQSLLNDSHLLISYAIQNKYIDVFFIPEYHSLLLEYLKAWQQKAEKNELYSLLYEVYSKRITTIQELPYKVVNTLKIVRERDGWKHDHQAILDTYNRQK